MIASLPMYDRPENAAAHDALWCAIRDALRDRGLSAPDTLTRDIAFNEAWLRPDLVLGQTCGMPYRTRLHGAVTLIGTLDYGLPDCPPGHYRSLFIARSDSPDSDLAAYASRRFAYNQRDSHSGWAAPVLAAAARGFALAPTLATGGHRASAQSVAEGRADIAAIDAITWRGIERWEPALAARLRIVDQTAPTPGLPLIAAKGTDAQTTFAAVLEALSALAPEMREWLGIRGIRSIPASEYLAVENPAPPVQSAHLI